MKKSPKGPLDEADKEVCGEHRRQVGAAAHRVTAADAAYVRVIETPPSTSEAVPVTKAASSEAR